MVVTAATTPNPRTSAAWLVLLSSGIAGFWIGTVAFPEWQVAVETAQVVAGVVHYPSVTPAYLYHTSLWTVLHQVLAVPLRMGVSESQLSLVVSGLLGMMSLQALSMFVYALSRDAVLALVAAMVVLIGRLAEFGVVYPVYLLGTPHTYGTVGLSLVVLTISLIGAAWYRTGAFLLGVAPSIHPSLGVWLVAVVGLSLVWDIKRRRAALQPAIKYLVAGYALTALSFALHFFFVEDRTAIDRQAAATYLARFVEVWDVHRQPVSLQADGVYLNAGAFALALVFLVAFKEDVPDAARVLLRALVVTAVLGAAFMGITWMSPSTVPSTLLVLMPARLLNLNAMTFVTLLIGLVGLYRRTLWGPPLLLLLIAALLMGQRSMLWDWTAGEVRPRWLDPIETWRVLKVSSALLVALAVWQRLVRGRRFGWATGRFARRAPDSVAWAAVSAPLLFLVWYTWPGASPRPLHFVDRTNDPLFRVAAESDGLLLGGGNLSMMQLRTRRPVLIDGGGFDGLPYAIEAAPATVRILRDVYNIDFFDPPAEARQTGAIPPEHSKTVWEGFSRERWWEIRRDYQVTQVVTPAGWSLNLPLSAQSDDFRLYELPSNDK
jgi:hypothetical protein